MNRSSHNKLGSASEITDEQTTLGTLVDERFEGGALVLQRLRVPAETLALRDVPSLHVQDLRRVELLHLRDLLLEVSDHLLHLVFVGGLALRVGLRLRGRVRRRRRLRPLGAAVRARAVRSAGRLAGGGGAFPGEGRFVFGAASFDGRLFASFPFRLGGGGGGSGGDGLRRWRRRRRTRIHRLRPGCSDLLELLLQLRDGELSAVEFPLQLLVVLPLAAELSFGGVHIPSHLLQLRFELRNGNFADLEVLLKFLATLPGDVELLFGGRRIASDLLEKLRHVGSAFFGLYLEGDRTGGEKLQRQARDASSRTTTGR
ncbi:hypothetical protein EYF80_042413 [Liparis tanakae]|uniref:Uncharacterized protein n=1 Tax=Liparis tanakae TaxID=230148 RepID=A0A4Z2G2M6_9TELE|nr:hypothetical protein EYF80_042413 [Liparis tanakae]